MKKLQVVKQDKKKRDARGKKKAKSEKEVDSIAGKKKSL